MNFTKKAFTTTLMSIFGSLVLASSHMDAPLITLDDAANTTDVYAFRSSDGTTQYLTTALAVYPFEEPSIGPNTYNFDDNVLYAIHLALGDDVAAGRTTLSYQFRFTTSFKNVETILQSYLGVVNDVDDASQNLTQTYTVTLVDHRADLAPTLGSCVVPPNNQGIATPLYNQADNGENPAKSGATTSAELDPYTSQAICSLDSGYLAFAGQRDDGFYAYIQAVFDLLQLRGPEDRFDSQSGFNVHTMVLNIPLSELNGEMQVVGVYATTSRQSVTILREDNSGPQHMGNFVQVARQGNPLFNEAFVAIEDKDLYNRTSPQTDDLLFSKYALNPELAVLINAILFGGQGPAIETDRTDLAGIFIPDVIKVDLSTGPARLAGPPDDEGFSRLSVFGGDALTSAVQPGLPGFPAGTIPGGWPNGRRFGDDVLDIAVTAAISDLRSDPLIINGPAGDSVDANDIAYNKVFPYAATPLNGRLHAHNGLAETATLNFAHFGNGEGFSSDIVLTNPSDTTEVLGRIDFRDANGNPLFVGIVAAPGIVPSDSTISGGSGLSFQLTSSVDVVLPRLGTLTVSTDGTGPVAVGSAIVTADAALGGVIRFNIPGIGIAGVPVSQPLQGFTIPVRREMQINSGIAISSTARREITLNLRLLDAEGRELTQRKIENFPARGHMSLFIDELFLEADTNGFRGSLVVEASGGVVIATALELGNQPGQFTTLPVTPLQ